MCTQRNAAQRPRYPSGWEGASTPTWNSAAPCKNTDLKSSAMFRHVRAQLGIAHARLTSPRRAGSGLAGRSLRWPPLCEAGRGGCAAFSRWQNELFSPPLLWSKCRNTVCPFLLLLTEHWLQPRRPLSEYTHYTIYVLNCWHTLSNNRFTSCLAEVWSPNLNYKSHHFVRYCINLKVIELIYGLSFWIINHTSILHFL